MSFDKENTLPFAESSSLSTNGDSCTKKRQRQPTDACEPSFDEEGRCKTRRVDPDRLAERLPLDLVKEMDAHIFPGAKMPVFEVRKSMQERYSVDRRNIYDYFHSRGLRVSKEDKHQNLVRSRKAAAAKTAPATGTPPPASITAPSTDPNKRRKVGPRPSLRHYASTPFPSAKNSTPSSTSSKDNTSAPLASRPLPTRTAVPSRLSDASGRTEDASPASLMQRLAATRSEPVLVPDYSSSSAKPAVVEIALPFDRYGRYVEDSSASVVDTAAEDFDLSTTSVFS